MTLPAAVEVEPGPGPAVRAAVGLLLGAGLGIVAACLLRPRPADPPASTSDRG